MPWSAVPCSSAHATHSSRTVHHEHSASPGSDDSPLLGNIRSVRPSHAACSFQGPGAPARISRSRCSTGTSSSRHSSRSPANVSSSSSRSARRRSMSGTAPRYPRGVSRGRRLGVPAVPPLRESRWPADTPSSRAAGEVPPENVSVLSGGTSCLLTASTGHFVARENDARASTHGAENYSRRRAGWPEPERKRATRTPTEPTLGDIGPSPRTQDTYPPMPAEELSVQALTSATGAPMDGSARERRPVQRRSGRRDASAAPTP
jgi:hypothetical protein